MFGVAKISISHWLKKKQDIYRASDENNAGTKRKRMKSATYEKLDNAIYKWLVFISVRHSNIPISASIIKLLSLRKVLNVINPKLLMNGCAAGKSAYKQRHAYELHILQQLIFQNVYAISFSGNDDEMNA